MQIFGNDKTYDFMSKSKLFLAVSILTILASYFFLFTKGLNFGVDFAGGTIVQVKYDKKANLELIRSTLNQNETFANSYVTNFGSDEEVAIKIKTSSQSVATDIGDTIKLVLKPTGDFTIRRVDMVGPKVGGELREKGLMAMVLAIIAILIYVSIRFEYRFAVASIVALVHDISIALGAISLFAIEVNLDILAALLTILGYSLNDTIIVFDRIREGIKTSKSIKLFEVINQSVSKTLSRTTLTSLTTFFVVLTLYLFGGEIIKGFSFTLLIGIVVGTCSSIFIASPFLKWLNFSISSYRQKEAQKEKLRKEKEKIRAQYEQGMV
jgi:preprotein translocase subunit SecF